MKLNNKFRFAMNIIKTATKKPKENNIILESLVKENNRDIVTEESKSNSKFHNEAEVKSLY